jgi:hypothetical protein
MKEDSSLRMKETLLVFQCNIDRVDVAEVLSVALEVKGSSNWKEMTKSISNWHEYH